MPTNPIRCSTAISVTAIVLAVLVAACDDDSGRQTSDDTQMTDAADATSDGLDTSSGDTSGDDVLSDTGGGDVESDTAGDAVEDSGSDVPGDQTSDADSGADTGSTDADAIDATDATDVADTGDAGDVGDMGMPLDCQGLTGAGTMANPYEIAIPEQWPCMNEARSAHFRVTADLDLGTLTDLPIIGDSAAPFTGALHGGGNTVSNPEIKLGQADTGLFGVTDGAEIGALTVVDADISGLAQTGVLVGHAMNTTIVDVVIDSPLLAATASPGGGVVGRAESSTLTRVTGRNIDFIARAQAGGLVGHAVMTDFDTVTLDGGFIDGRAVGPVGGLVGDMAGGTMTDATANGQVVSSALADAPAGGVVGELRDGASITGCTADGTVRGTNPSGGVIGQLSDTSAIAQCTSTVDVGGMGTGSFVASDSGGLVGHAPGGTIAECHAAGAVNGTDAVGGLVGRATGVAISDSYADGVVTGDNDVGGLVGLADGAVVIETSYAGGTATGATDIGGLVGDGEGGSGAAGADRDQRRVRDRECLEHRRRTDRRRRRDGDERGPDQCVV